MPIKSNMCMFKTISSTVKYGLNLIKNSLRDIKIKKKRSPFWSKIEKEFKEKHPKCEICGSTKRLQTHHIKPFHIFPELELDQNNLISLCMSRKQCHIFIGHGSLFKASCPKIREYAKLIQNKKITYEELCILAKKERVL